MIKQFVQADSDYLFWKVFSQVIKTIKNTFVPESHVLHKPSFAKKIQ